MADRIAEPWGERTPYRGGTDWPVRTDMYLLPEFTEARADLDIFLDYARRMDFRNADGEPLIGWTDPESAFEAWKECSRGRPCDYKQANGRAFLHAVPHQPSPEVPSDDYPLLLTIGRTIHHFHTRTKTGRTPQLRDAAPEPWAELTPADAEALGIADGDPVRVESPRGAIRVPVRIRDGRAGVVFVPFHYGYWDLDAAGPDGGEGRAVNELILAGWDPVSKQPIYKVAAVRVTKSE